MSMDPEYLDANDKADMAWEPPAADPDTKHCEECEIVEDLTWVDDGAGGLLLCTLHLLRNDAIKCLEPGCDHWVFADIRNSRRCIVCREVRCEEHIIRRRPHKDVIAELWCVRCLAIERGVA